MEARELAPNEAGLWDKRYVEVQGAGGEVEALDYRLGLLGESVDPQGKHGTAHWDPATGLYYVVTADGLVLPIPETRLVEHAGPEAEGYDVIWPTVSFARAGATFARGVVDNLRRKSYCVIQMPEGDKRGSTMATALGQRTDFTLPIQEFEEGFLGHHKASKVLFCLEAEPLEGPARDAFQHYYSHLANLHNVLTPAGAELLGFTPTRELHNSLLRMPLESEGEHELISPGTVTPEDIENGLVEVHLDFIQRRTLCFMYLLNGDGNVELWPKSGGDGEADAVALSLPSGSLLVFRHDELGYSYRPSTSSDVVLQSWMINVPQELRLDSLQGGQGSLDKLMGGPLVLPLEQQVHIMAGVCRFPGNGYRLERDWLVYATQTDTFVEIPFFRFDLNLYYTSDADQFGGAGKSSTKHAGLINDKELIEFDNEFFGIDHTVAMCMPCIQRVLMEVAYEGFVMFGYDMKSLNGADIYSVVADIGIEWDSFHGYHQVPEQWLEATSSHSISSGSRLSHTFGLRGPAIQVDTACSASLVGANIKHAALRRHKENGIKEGFVMGQQHIIQPWPFIGLSAAGMLGRGGRSKTFDQSANGYNRGEGCGGFFSRVGDDLESTQNRLACYVGSYVNQDGRSASLTAPNGPSQQAVIRGSLNAATLAITQPAGQENHGTGTALGDPIETGSVRSVFRKREVCLPTTSGKSHMGHLEAGAGIIGILKTLCSLLHGGIPGNCHLRQCNAHCDFDGFPGAFPVELFCLPADHNYAGANGFGFGGTNSRADFWAHRRNKIFNARELRGEFLSHHYSIGDMDLSHQRVPLMPKLDTLDFVAVECAKCKGPMCWLCGVAIPDNIAKGKHHCSMIRDQSSNYTYCSLCYEGDYEYEGVQSESLDLFVPGQKVFLTTSADAWTNLHEMEPVSGAADVDMYQGEILLGDTRQERFHIVLKRGRNVARIYPVAKNAGPRFRIMGPGKDNENRNWMIDGHRDGSPEGTVYSVRFFWGDHEKSIEWEPVRQEAPRYEHEYFLVNSLSKWAPANGSRDLEDPSIWHWFQGTLPKSGVAELLFVRDGDMNQMIYPMQALQSQPTNTAIPIVGPDDGGSGKRWMAWGAEGEALCADLCVKDGTITVTVKTETMGEWTWTGTTCHLYYATGSFNNWAFSDMEEEEGNPDARVFHFTIGGGGREEFQIVLDQNSNMRMYPANKDEAPGAGMPCGPDRKGRGKNWVVEGPPGQEMEIRLDFNAEDDLGIVTCNPAWWWEEDAD